MVEPLLDSARPRKGNPRAPIQQAAEPGPLVQALHTTREFIGMVRQCRFENDRKAIIRYTRLGSGPVGNAAAGSWEEHFRPEKLGVIGLTFPFRGALVFLSHARTGQQRRMRQDRGSPPIGACAASDDPASSKLGAAERSQDRSWKKSLSVRHPALAKNDRSAPSGRSRRPSASYRWVKSRTPSPLPRRVSLARGKKLGSKASAMHSVEVRSMYDGSSTHWIVE